MAEMMREKAPKRPPIYFEGRVGNHDTGVTPESLRPALISDGVLNLPRYHPQYTMSKLRYTEGYENFGANHDEDVKPIHINPRVDHKRYDDVLLDDLLEDAPEKAVHVEPLYTEDQRGKIKIISEVPEPGDIRKQCCGDCCYCCCVWLPNCCSSGSSKGCCPTGGSKSETRHLRAEKMKEVSSSSGGPYDDCCCWRYLCCKSCSGPRGCCSPWCTSMTAVTFKIIALVLLLLLALGIGLAVGLGALDRDLSNKETNVRFNATFKLNNITYLTNYSDVNSAASRTLTSRICSSMGKVLNDSILAEQRSSNVSDCYPDKYLNGSIWCYMIVEIISLNANKSWLKSDQFLGTIDDALQSDFTDSTGHFRTEFRESTAITDVTVQWIRASFDETGSGSGSKITTAIKEQQTTGVSQTNTISNAAMTTLQTGKSTFHGHNSTGTAQSIESTTSGVWKNTTEDIRTTVSSDETGKTLMQSEETRITAGTSGVDNGTLATMARNNATIATEAAKTTIAIGVRDTATMISSGIDRTTVPITTILITTVSMTSRDNAKIASSSSSESVTLSNQKTSTVDLTTIQKSNVNATITEKFVANATTRGQSIANATTTEKSTANATIT